MVGLGCDFRTDVLTAASLSCWDARHHEIPSPRQTDLNLERNKPCTLAIISQPDAGKTTLTEKLLLFGGANQMAGTVKGRKASRHATRIGDTFTEGENFAFADGWMVGSIKDRARFLAADLLLSRKCAKIRTILFLPRRVGLTAFVSDRRDFPDYDRDLLCRSVAITGRTRHG
ncbi:MAG: hypothetical protein K6346_00310 [Halothiobacillaceae bacterium]